MIERYQVPRLVQSARREDPLVLAVGRASVDCGCHGLWGERLDTRKPVAVLRRCQPGHDELVRRASALVGEALAAGDRRDPLVLVEAALQSSASGRTL